LKLTIPPLVIEKHDGFSKDALGREEYGKSLLNLITNSDDELVIALDGKWGEGKTTFVKMWQGLLSSENIPNIYINAFSNDYLDDAFISIASAIIDYADSHKSDNSVDLKKNVKKIGSQLIPLTAQIGIKAATLGLIGKAELDQIESVKNDIATGMSNLIGRIIEERINSHKENIEAIESFRNLLSELPSKLQNNNDKPLVIIIDELDRCRPTFAVEIIEKVKHLFSVKNIVFVLVMNKQQLEESIKCVYGRNIDAHTYLQKFISLEAKLPKRIKQKLPNDLFAYSRKLFELHNIQAWDDKRNIIDCLDPLALHFNLSLRELEKVYTNLSIFYGASKENEYRLVPIIIFLAIIKVLKPKLFESILHQKITYEEVIKELQLNVPTEDNFRTHKLYWLMQWVRYALLNQEEINKLSDSDPINDFFESATNSLLNYNITREELIPYFAERFYLFGSE